MNKKEAIKELVKKCDFYKRQYEDMKYFLQQCYGWRNGDKTVICEHTNTNTTGFWWFRDGELKKYECRLCGAFKKDSIKVLHDDGDSCIFKHIEHLFLLDKITGALLLLPDIETLKESD